MHRVWAYTPTVTVLSIRVEVVTGCGLGGQLYIEPCLAPSLPALHPHLNAYLQYTSCHSGSFGNSMFVSLAPDKRT